MIPIYEQGDGEGIGHLFESFQDRFISICESHIEDDRAKAFAFIFYDFQNEAVRHVLKSLGGFAELDRLSGKNLSVFYLHSDNRKMIKRFNSHFLSALDVEDNAHIPCVLFFKLSKKKIKDITIIELERSDLAFAFNELYTTIENYIENLDNDFDAKSSKNKIIKVYKKTKSIAYNKFIEILMEGVF